MPRYSQNRYDFVIDSSFRPFSMQEMMAPLAMYKDAYEKTEEQYVDLQDKANKFKYLSTTLPEDSEARQLYEGYANDLKAQAEDLVRNGLNIGNRRALTELRGRYSGEIGMLAEAKENLNKERELRRQMSAKDPSMLFEDDDLTIDKYLYGRTPSNYGISGTELYTKAATSAQAISKRIFNARDGGKTLGGYYRDYVQRMGYTPEQLSKFGEQISADFANWAATNIPELGMAANQILEANGVNEHLSGNNLKKAQTQVIRGLIDGAVYTESHNPTRDLGVITAAEKDAAARADRQYNEITKPAFEMEKEKWDREKEEDDIRRSIMYRQKPDGTWEYNPTYINNSDYEMDPNGKWRKKTSTTSAEEKAATKEATAKGTALMKLERKDLAHNSGFDVTFGDNRHHYDYIGAVSKHGSQWKSGAIGEDVPGRFYDWTSSSNVMHWGNFSAEGADKKTQMKVLSEDDVMRLMTSDMDLNRAIQERIDKYCEERGIDPDSPEAKALDIQLVEVPNEGKTKRKGYLIAIH